MATITRIEDITSIVGVDNYIKSLALDKEKLIFLKSYKKHKGIRFEFAYFERIITVDVDRMHNIYDMSCNCGINNNYCPHIALAIMYLLKHEKLVNDSLLLLDEEADSNFNKELFRNLAEDYSLKEKISLDIILKDTYYSEFKEYELQVKIGSRKKYVLNKHLGEFLELYKNKSGSLTFGKEFTYDAKSQYFDSNDTKIIEFLEFYFDSQNTSFTNYYGYHANKADLEIIKLSGTTLNKFLELLFEHDFTYSHGYYGKLYHGIEKNSDLNFNIELLNNKIKVTYNFKSLQPFTSDYHYLIDDDKVYYCSEPKLYKMLKERNIKQLIFNRDEYDSFANIIYPAIKKANSKINVDSSLNEVLELKYPSVRYYFDLNDDIILCTIKLVYKDIEKNIFDSNLKFGETYVCRDKDKELNYISELDLYHFVKDSENMNFYLSDIDLFAYFMNDGLSKLTSKYEVFVSKRLKELKIIDKSRIESSFKIGRNNILSFDFNIDDVMNDEIENILESIHEGKKYYRLKNGNLLNIEDKNLNKFENIVDALDIDTNKLKHGSVDISKYKAIGLDEYTDFVKLDNKIHQIINNFKNYKNINVEFSKEESNLLREYQKTGICWMLTLASCGFGGILADEMGLGKSLQTIKYIEKRKSYASSAKTLIVVPTSLVYNWQNEFIKYNSTLRVVTVLDNKKKREEILSKIDDYDVLITTYGLIRQDLPLYERISFDTIIIDEAQNIKNVNTDVTHAVKSINSLNHFALTGTPIENSTLELYSIFDFIMPGFFPSLASFKSKYSIKKIEDDSSLLMQLKHQVSPFILRRRKKDVLKDLPDKIENKIYVDLTSEQKKIYVAYLEKTKREIKEVIKKEGFMKSQILILSLLTKLRELCIDPNLIINDYNGESAKMIISLDIIKENIENGHKMLLFSQFPSALKILKNHLEKNNIKSFYLDGSTKSKERIRLVEEFNKNDIPIFLISLKAGGTGLNLTSADVVIHLDPWWNPQVENQATDRSHRIGQKNVVEVVKLITKGTIEERIIELQEKKKKLSDAVIEGENSGEVIISKLTEDELKNLLFNN